MRRASSWLVPIGTVARLSEVINSRTGWRGFSANRTSRLVRIPTSLPEVSTIGMPEMRCSFIRSNASDSVWSGVIVIGLITIPLSNRLTARTAAACASRSMLRWRTPMPPSCASAIAMSASVTVSIADDSNGMLSGMSRVRKVRVSALEGSTLDSSGWSNTSSNVSPSGISSCKCSAMRAFGRPRAIRQARQPLPYRLRRCWAMTRCMVSIISPSKRSAPPEAAATRRLARASSSAPGANAAWQAAIC